MRHTTDRYRNRPVVWSQRHELILRKHIAGKRTKDIAEALGYARNRVSAILHSPLFEQHKARLLRELQGTTVDDLLEEIRQQAIPNLEFLIELRDDPEVDARVRLQAARAIAKQIQRVLPTKDGQAADNGEVRIVLDGGALERMVGALAEDDGAFLEGQQ